MSSDLTLITPTIEPPMDRAPDSLALLTLLIWALALIVGILGLLLPYPHPPIPTHVPAPTQARLVTVALHTEPPPPAPLKMPAPALCDPSPDLPAPPAPAAVSIPTAPPLAVAAPAPSISFALPANGFTTLVDPSKAARAQPNFVPLRDARPDSNATAQRTNNAPLAAPPITHLTFGEGEGRQPAPDYPRTAQLAGQEGAVSVRFAVDLSGQVTSLTITIASRWPLLNQAATRAIRNTWHFSPGPPRTYDVTILFQLSE